MCEPTFSLDLRFKEVPENGRIETAPFLDCCSCVVPFFDQLGPTTFAPVKMDINGNIKKLRAIYDSDQCRFHTLQDIVEVEIKSQTTKAKNSGTDALLWLKRALQFIVTFLKELIANNRVELVPCAQKAYECSLKRYHGFIVKTVFNVAVRSVPYRKDFFEKLKGNTKKDEQQTMEEKDEFDIMEEISDFLELLEANLDSINNFYIENDLDDPKKV